MQTKESKPSAHIDLQDVLLVLGFSSLEAGVTAIYWPAALILGGIVLLGCALAIERTKAIAAKERKA